MQRIGKIGLVILILSLMTLGYGGICRKKNDHPAVITGSSGGGDLPNTDPVVISVGLNDASPYGQDNGWHLVCSYQWRGSASGAGPGKSIDVITGEAGNVDIYVPYEAWYTTLAFAIAITKTPDGIDWNDPEFPYSSVWSEEWLVAPGANPVIAITTFADYFLINRLD